MKIQNKPKDWISSQQHKYKSAQSTGEHWCENWVRKELGSDALNRLLKYILEMWRLLNCEFRSLEYKRGVKMINLILMVK